MDEVQFAAAMRGLKEHADALQLLLDEARSRFTHPAMSGTVMRVAIDGMLQDMEHHTLRLVIAADSLRESVDRRRGLS